jgi:hypothetical protein
LRIRNVLLVGHRCRIDGGGKALQAGRHWEPHGGWQQRAVGVANHDGACDQVANPLMSRGAHHHQHARHAQGRQKPVDKTAHHSQQRMAQPDRRSLDGHRSQAECLLSNRATAHQRLGQDRVAHQHRGYEQCGSHVDR